MAEIAGLTLGALGLAGLIGALKDVVDLFSTVIDANGLGRDYELLSTKLDVEKTLLLQWARRTNILQPTYDRRLDDPAVQSSVLRILSCMRLLLGDEAALEQRYGLRRAADVPSPPGGGLITKSSSSNTVSLMDKFYQEFEALNVRISTRRRTDKWPAKVRWAIRDKARFESLVNEIAYFTTKLNETLPPGDSTVPTLSPCPGPTQKLEETSVKQLQERVLDALSFRAMNDREQCILSAYPSTLQWVFQPPELDYPWDDLSRWLRQADGVYWISGKAGSGKSTLMKYLYTNTRTRELLSQWAGGPCALVGHFFWNLGTGQQKSYPGLLRSLLHQILTAKPSLIPTVLPATWREALHTEPSRIAEPPSPAELRQAFNILRDNALHVGSVCVVIDGLDEFDGDYHLGIELIQQLAKIPGIKTIVSSRPIPDCVAAFDQLPRLQLHHLNSADIRSYVNDSISSHRYMKALMARHPGEASEIMTDLVEKSSGVFLWVVLACRSLLAGFAAGDRISELRRRVDELPPELEEMFQHMLSKVEPRYRDQGAQLLRLCFTKQRAYERREVAGLCESLNALGLALLEESPGGFEPPSLEYDDMVHVCQVFASRLRSRCGGLLELTANENCTCWSPVQILYGRRDSRYAAEQKVTFMHRTVYEFLGQEEVWELPCLRIAGEQWADASEQLSLLGLSLAKHSLAASQQYNVAIHFLMDGIIWGAISDRTPPWKSQTIFGHLQSVLDQPIENNMNRSLPAILRQIIAEIGPYHDVPCASHTALMIAVESGATNFVKSHPAFHVLAGARRPACGCLPPIYHAACQPMLRRILRAGNVPCGGETRTAMLAKLISKDMISLLLQAGGDMNQRVSHDSQETYWERTMTILPRIWPRGGAWWKKEHCSRLEFADVAMVFLDASAEQRKVVFSRQTVEYLRWWLEDCEDRTKFPSPKATRVWEKLFPRLEAASDLST